MHDMEHFKLLAESASRESRHIDFKESFVPSSSQDWARIIKDVIAFANSTGGVIVFGVEDDGTPATFDRNIVLRIDPAVIADKIFAYTGENFTDFEIAEVIRRKKRFAALFIGPTPTPLVFARVGADIVEGSRQKPAFVKGTVYFRHGAKSDPGTTNDIRMAINREVNRLKRSWLQGIRKIAKIEPGEEVFVSRPSMKVPRLVPGKIVADENAQTFRPDNAAEIWPHRTKELVIAINGRLKKKKISFHDILCVKKRYGIDERNKPNFIYKPYPDVAPRYSEAFVDWLLSEASRNPKVFREARELFKRSRKEK